MRVGVDPVRNYAILSSLNDVSNGVDFFKKCGILFVEIKRSFPARLFKSRRDPVIRSINGRENIPTVHVGNLIIFEPTKISREPVFFSAEALLRKGTHLKLNWFRSFSPTAQCGDFF